MNLKVIKKYLASFLKTDWELSDYPLEYKHYKVYKNDSPNPERFKPIAECIMIINWPQMQGNGDTEEEALENLKQAFKIYKVDHEKLPRDRKRHV